MSKIYTQNDLFFKEYHAIEPGDLFNGRLRLKQSQEILLIDLLSRNISLFPSALSQIISKSKVLQAFIFGSQWMIPDTVAVYDVHDLQKAVSLYNQREHDGCITKMDRKDGGQGLHHWDSTEMVYNAASLGLLAFPFVMQPFLPAFRDVRVIILGDRYEEAYERSNPYNFRKNLHFGGTSEPVILQQTEKDFCLSVMKRGGFSYAHIDLMLGDTFMYLSEINLRGGLRGASITSDRYRQYVDSIHAQAHNT